jgi:hypothetical protein
MKKGYQKGSNSSKSKKKGQKMVKRGGKGTKNRSRTPSDPPQNPVLDALGGSQKIKIRFLEHFTSGYKANCFIANSKLGKVGQSFRWL